MVLCRPRVLHGFRVLGVDSESCQTYLARPRRCSDPGRFVAEDSPENSICLPRATRGYRGRRRAGRLFNSGKNEPHPDPESFTDSESFPSRPAVTAAAAAGAGPG